MNWKPILEAPKDGTLILLCDGFNMFVGSWGRDYEGADYYWRPMFGDTVLWDTYDSYGEAVPLGSHPLYWMPLPTKLPIQDLSSKQTP